MTTNVQIQLDETSYTVADTCIALRSESGKLVATLVGTKCHGCGVLDIGARHHCANCSSSDVECQALMTHGALKTVSSVFKPAMSWIGNKPYVLGEIALHSGPTLVAEVLPPSDEALNVGSPVAVAVLDIELADGRHVLVPKLVRPTSDEPRETLSILSTLAPADKKEVGGA